MHIIIPLLTICLALLLCGAEALAQCQACKSVVESNLQEGGSIGLGINRGILYLLAMPYLAVMGVWVLWYIKVKKRKKEELHG
ncbi:MAG: hypothetical protein HYZ16_09400 [Bacteroidetes bacterium]|nr:hypothetical protein [Bacteroidota bacterium]